MVESLPFDIDSLHRAYSEGLEPSAVVRECLRRINSVEDPGIFLHLLSEDALSAQISELGHYDPVAKPLWGIPCGVKDNINLAGVPTTAACKEFSHIADADAEVVRLLKKAGALIIGKTNLDQFATGLVGVRTPYDVPKNALDPTIVPGGSSSGSAVAVAHGILSFSLGTDTAGSGRVPAALNGIVGLKPTLGMLSCSGVLPACRTLDTVSVFALCVQDAYRVFRLTNAFDPSDSYSRAIKAKPLRTLPPTFVVGVPSKDTIKFFGDQEQQASFNNSLTVLKAMGAEIREVDFSLFYQIASLLYEGSWVAERYAAVENMINKDPEALFPATWSVISKAKGKTAVDAFNDFYKLQDFKRLAEPLLNELDILCVPTIPTFYSVADLEKDPIQPNSNLGTYTNFVNLLDLCGISVPTAPRNDGRPGSITLLAKAGQDDVTASLALNVEQYFKAPMGATGWSLPTSQNVLESTSLGNHAEFIDLAVVGAHMSGLPLNHQLTELEALFKCKSRTAPHYRLFRLEGGPPLRPGMVRSVDGDSIDIEVWSMPSQSVGSFLAQVPSPLSIGTVELEDGSQVKGFLCENSATEQAEDITHLNGWRAYLASQSSI